MITDDVMQAAREAVAKYFESIGGDYLAKRVLDDWSEVQSAAIAILAERERNAEEIRKLHEALKPFAKAGELFEDRDPNFSDALIYSPAKGDEWSLCGDDLRRARAALNG